MKRFVLALALVALSCSLVFAEATFDQIQGLIKEQNYSAAVKGLELIIQNHPKSAKAFYAMSQAQAGLGNQVKAKEALDIATGIDPSLKFASSGNVENLKEALVPQTKKIEAIESHTGRNILIALFVLGGIGIFFFLRKKKEGDTVDYTFGKPSQTPPPMPVKDSGWVASENTVNRTQSAPISAVTPSEVLRRAEVPRPQFDYEPAQPRQYAPQPAPVQHTTVVNNGGGNDMLTGVLVGSMLNGGSHHDHERVVEREVVREREVEPSYSRSSRSEDTPSRSSSWDNDRSSSSRDSSWDSGSSSSSSSSWDSSSSGSSSSSSSWDSGSSDSGSSSSWD